MCHQGREHYRVGLSHLKKIVLYYLSLKRKKADAAILKGVQQRLWRETYERVLPILNNVHQLGDKVGVGTHWPLRHAMEILRSRGAMLLPNVHAYLFEGVPIRA